MDYASNSNKSKESADKPVKPEIEKVVTETVIVKEKSLGKRFKNVFFGGDFKGATQYVAADVLLPAVRNLIFDMGKTGMERMLYGDTKDTRGRAPTYGTRVQYNNPIQRRDPRQINMPDQPPHPYRQNRHEASDVVLQSREEAELVLERLIDITEKYDVASLADFYDLVGLPSSHTDNKWGWSRLGNAEVRQVRDGYLIDLPPMESL